MNMPSLQGMRQEDPWHNWFLRHRAAQAAFVLEQLLRCSSRLLTSWNGESPLPMQIVWAEAAFRSLQNERMRAWRIMDFRYSAARRSRSSAVRIRPGRLKKWSSADNKSIKSFLYIRMDCYFRIKRSLIIGLAKNVPNFRKCHNIFIINNG